MERQIQIVYPEFERLLLEIWSEKSSPGIHSRLLHSNKYDWVNLRLLPEPKMLVKLNGVMKSGPEIFLVLVRGLGERVGLHRPFYSASRYPYHLCLNSKEYYSLSIHSSVTTNFSTGGSDHIKVNFL